MRKLNIIVVFNTKQDKALFCIRAKEPFKGMYNFVGGKVEVGETNDEAAYRELFEETGIPSKDIQLDHFMDLNYFKYENNLQVYYGILKHEVNLVEEKNKLEWVSINEELKVNVYYYDSDEKLYDKITNNISMSEDGYYEFYIDHNSSYVLTNDEVSETYIMKKVDVNNTTATEEQKDDKYIMIAGFVLALFAFIFSLINLFKKK